MVMSRMMPIALLMVTGGFASHSISSCQTSYGQIDCGAEMIDQLSLVGKVSLSGTHVKGDAQIKGSLSANQAQLNHLRVEGQALLSNSQVSGSMYIDGYLSSDHVAFGPIVANSHRMRLSDSQVDSIRIQSTGSSPELHLLGKCQVKGDIEFTGDFGKVYRSSASTLGGNVKGGQIIEIDA